MKKHNQSGFSMIEVLVTIVVISFGFLSLLTLQMATLNNLSANNQNYVAISVANGMGERLRANRNNVTFYNGIDTADFDKDCSASVCSLIEYDAWEFQQSIIGESQLPEGSGTVSVVGGLATINITWIEKQARQVIPVTYSLQVPL